MHIILALKKLIAFNPIKQNINDTMRAVLEEQYIEPVAKAIKLNVMPDKLEKYKEQLALWQELYDDKNIWEKIVFNQTKNLKKSPMLEDYILDAMTEIWAKKNDIAHRISPFTDKPRDLINTIGRIVSNHINDILRSEGRHSVGEKIVVEDEEGEEKDVFDALEGHGDSGSNMEFKEILDSLYKYVAKQKDAETYKALLDIWMKALEHNVDVNFSAVVKLLAKRLGVSELSIYLYWRDLKKVIGRFFEEELGYRLSDDLKDRLKISAVGIIAIEHKLAYEEWRRSVARFVLGGLHEQVGTVFEKPDDVVARIREEKKNAGMRTASPLDGMPNEKARRIVNNILNRAAPKGIVRDSDWSHINLIWKALKGEHIEYTLSSADYRHDEQGRPSAKEWKFVIEFTNNNGKPTTLFGNITAHGAGNLDDLMEKYDVTALVG